MTKVAPIRNPKKMVEGLKNFHSWLGDVVPGACDVDFICERKHRFLVIELKDWFHGIHVPYGQHLLLYRLSKQPNTRVYLAGEAGETIHMAQYNDAPAPKFVKRNGRTFAYWEPARFLPLSKDGVRSVVQAWWEDAADAAG
ncbi:MAG: hypothetical protein WC822_05915 [Candidatus Paceibacterota bacterium]